MYRSTNVLVAFIILYIPIWLYSNFVFLKNTIAPNVFTFQSGYIQILSYRLVQNLHLSLHSNLVIFKCSANSDGLNRP